MPDISPNSSLFLIGWSAPFLSIKLNLASPQQTPRRFMLDQGHEDDTYSHLGGSAVTPSLPPPFYRQ